MIATVQRWGNSLALRIPKAVAQGAHIEKDSRVELVLEDHKLIVTPIEEPPLTLEALLAQITPENLHGEIDMGPPVGKEIW